MASLPALRKSVVEQLCFDPDIFSRLGPTFLGYASFCLAGERRCPCRSLNGRDVQSSLKEEADSISYEESLLSLWTQLSVPGS
jgi:hypothetical protein